MRRSELELEGLGVEGRAVFERGVAGGGHEGLGAADEHERLRRVPEAADDVRDLTRERERALFEAHRFGRVFSKRTRRGRASASRSGRRMWTARSLGSPARGILKAEWFLVVEKTRREKNKYSAVAGRARRSP